MLNEQSQLEEKLWKRVEKSLKYLQVVPFLRMVAVCNNLAFGKVNDESDIDLFIVAHKGRLFVVRTLVTLILHFLCVRRHGNKVAGRFCLSFFIDDSSLNLSEVALGKDYYLAYWIKSLLPVIDDNFSSSILASNYWAKSYFENPKDFEISNSKVFLNSFFFSPMQKVLLPIFSGKSGDFIENFLKNWQIKRARKKAKNAGDNSKIIISENMLKFHNIDRRSEYNEKWESKFGKDALLTDEKFKSLFSC